MISPSPPPTATLPPYSGRTASGKSTLFRCVLGFLAPSEGGILVNGKDMRTLDRRAAAREIAYIPQSCVPSFNYTLLEVVMMGLTNQIGVFDAPASGA